MIKDKGIPIHNIYYMLSYAFKELRQSNYENIDKEEFDNIYDLLAEIFPKESRHYSNTAFTKSTTIGVRICLHLEES